MSTITAYTPAGINIEDFGGQFHINDSAASAMFGRDVKVGVANIINGFVHYYGVRGAAHEGVQAVIRPRNGDPMGTLEAELMKGLANGRDDRK